MNHEIKVTHTQQPGFGPMSLRFTTEDPEWNELIATLKAVKADHWNRNYVDTVILDSSSIDIFDRTPELKVQTYCNNAIPDGFDKFGAALEQAIEVSERDWATD